jgi:hypothetical protein
MLDYNLRRGLKAAQAQHASRACHLARVAPSFNAMSTALRIMCINGL